MGSLAGHFAGVLTDTSELTSLGGGGGFFFGMFEAGLTQDGGKLGKRTRVCAWVWEWILNRLTRHSL